MDISRVLGTEIIYQRIDATKPNLGLTNIKGNKPTKQETEVAKNYLTETELNMLNRMVSAYLDLAEIQALNQKPMYMTDWITKLDEFIKISGNDILDHLGSISHQEALQKRMTNTKNLKNNLKMNHRKLRYTLLSIWKVRRKN